jgi:predicted phosphodiesterase
MSESFLPPRRKGAVRILAFSDWRVQDYDDLLQFIKNVPTCDIIVYAGDDLDRLIASQDAVRQAVEMTAEGRLLFVAGNDDVPEDRELLGELPFCHDLHKTPYKFENFVFLGLEGTERREGRSTGRNLPRAASRCP